MKLMIYGYLCGNSVFHQYLAENNMKGLIPISYRRQADPLVAEARQVRMATRQRR